MTNELRKDPLLSGWVAVLEDSWGPERYPGPIPEPVRPEDGCYLCNGEAGVLEVRAEVPAPGGRAVRAVESPAPVLGTGGSLGRKGVGMYDRMLGVGAHEVVVESPDHDTPPEDLGSGHMAQVVRMFLMRVDEIGRDERIRHVLIGRGRWSPASPLGAHPHAEILATPVIPPHVKAELDGAKAYYAYKERCVFCDILDEEIRSGHRVVAETEHFVAFCPFASRFPFEMWVMPRRHLCEFQSIEPPEVDDLGLMLAGILGRFRRLLGGRPASYVVHSAPLRIPRRNHWHSLGDDFHWHVEVKPLVGPSPDLSWGSGLPVLTTAPEVAARHLKEV